jgi:hypothetical protein
MFGFKRARLIAEWDPLHKVNTFLDEYQKRLEDEDFDATNLTVKEAAQFIDAAAEFAYNCWRFPQHTQRVNSFEGMLRDADGRYTWEEVKRRFSKVEFLEDTKGVVPIYESQEIIEPILYQIVAGHNGYVTSPGRKIKGPRYPDSARRAVLFAISLGRDFREGLRYAFDTRDDARCLHEFVGGLEKEFGSAAVDYNMFCPVDYQQHKHDGTLHRMDVITVGNFMEERVNFRMRNPCFGLVYER